jgi:pyruvate kinase
MLVKMLDAGMNVARIDFSEGDFQTHDNNLAALGAARK